MATSQSRRISEFELSCKENFQSKTLNESFYRLCKKSVNVVDVIIEKKSIEAWLVCGIEKIFSNFYRKPDWINNFRGKFCEVCENRVD